MNLQKTYEIIDASFYDTGLTDSTVEYVTSGTGTNETTSNGRIITGTGSGNYQCFANKRGTSTGNWYDWDYPFAVEFDVIAVTNIPRFQIYSQATNTSNNWDFNQTGHYKIVYDGINITKYYNGEQQGTPTALTLGTARIGFVLELNESVTVKDFLIYPI